MGGCGLGGGSGGLGGLGGDDGIFRNGADGAAINIGGGGGGGVGGNFCFVTLRSASYMMSSKSSNIPGKRGGLGP